MNYLCNVCHKEPDANGFQVFQRFNYQFGKTINTKTNERTPSLTGSREILTICNKCSQHPEVRGMERLFGLYGKEIISATEMHK